jgi:hypothetical protein
VPIGSLDEVLDYLHQERSFSNYRKRKSSAEWSWPSSYCFFVKDQLERLLVMVLLVQVREVECYAQLSFLALMDYFHQVSNIRYLNFCNLLH